MKYTLQAIFFISFMLVVGLFSSWPVYQHIQPGLARIKLSFSHAGERREDCIRLTSEEIAQLPPQERKPFDCSRERLPVYVELSINDRILISEWLPPTGISRDGASTIYETFDVSAGQHTITARLRDSRRDDGFDFEQSVTTELVAGRNFIIDFREELGGFLFNET